MKRLRTNSGPFLSTTSGPPESPLQVLVPPAPLVQMLEDCTIKGKEVQHAVLVMTVKSTKLNTWLTVIEPPKK